ATRRAASYATESTVLRTHRPSRTLLARPTSASTIPTPNTEPRRPVPRSDRRARRAGSPTDLLDLRPGPIRGVVHHAVEAGPQRDAEERHDEHRDSGTVRITPMAGRSARPVNTAPAAIYARLSKDDLTERIASQIGRCRAHCE